VSVIAFGDLARAASGHLEAAAQLPAMRLETDTVAAAIGQGCRLGGALARYLDDVIGEDSIHPVIGEEAGTAVRAAAQAREAVRMAAARLWAAGVVFASADLPCGPLAAGLADGVTFLNAGRDLLATHVTIDADGMRRRRADLDEHQHVVTRELPGRHDRCRRQMTATRSARPAARP
jgi:hypothetical protein